MSVEALGKIAGGADGGGMSSLDMAAMGTRVEAARFADQEQQVSQAAARATAPAPGAPAKELAKLRQVSQDFESIFLGYMMKTMRESVPKGSLWGQSQGEQIFSEMRDDEMAKGLAKAGGIGLAKLLEDQLKQTLATQARAAEVSKSDLKA